MRTKAQEDPFGSQSTLKQQPTQEEREQIRSERQQETSKRTSLAKRQRKIVQERI